MEKNKHILRKFFQEEDETTRKKLEFFWNKCMPEKEDSVAAPILKKTLQKIQTNPGQQSHPRKYRLYFKAGYITIASVAASILLIIWGSRFLQDSPTEDIKQIAATMEPLSFEKTENITLVMDDSAKLQLKTDAQIAYTSQGDVSVNSKSVSSRKISKKEKKVSFNQLVVPKGKRSQLLLSDGTKVWVNSGTRVIYPSVFSPDKREIYVEGEVYMEVTHDEDCPFFVNTSGFEVKVLGTSFDVFAYKQMPVSRVVLAEGSVEIKDTHNKQVSMVPNELVSIGQAGIEEKVKVNAGDYKAWIEGIMVLKGEPLQVLVERLSVLYGENIVCDSSLDNEQIYGKLDLRENLDEILEYIKSMIPISAREENGMICLKRVN